MLQLHVLAPGAVQGSIHGLIGFGFVLIYLATEAINFAQHVVMMLGTFAGLACTVGFSLPVGIFSLAAIVAMAVLGRENLFSWHYHAIPVSSTNVERFAVGHPWNQQ